LVEEEGIEASRHQGIKASSRERERQREEGKEKIKHPQITQIAQIF